MSEGDRRAWRGGEDLARDGGADAAPGKKTVSQTIQRRAAGRAPDEPGPALATLDPGGGSALPGAARATFERSAGADLSDVRVHTGSSSAAAAAELGARAFTTGRDIHFGAGQYRPDDPFGMHLLSHEVAHTVQQSGGAAVQAKLAVSEPGDPAEVAADAFADAIVHGGPAPVLAPVSAGAIHRTPADGGPKELAPKGADGKGGGPGDVAIVRRRLAAGRAILADKNANLDATERAQLEAAIASAEAALRSYEGLSAQGQTQTAMMGGLALAGGGIVADDATGVGVADDPLLIIVGLGMLATWLLTRSPPSDAQLQGAWSSLVDAIKAVATAGEVLIALKLNGDKIRGNTERLAEHLARILAIAAVGGVPSGEPPKNNNDNDPHWWKEIKAFLKNIRDGIGDASRKQVMRELRKKFSEEQIAEIERRLIEAAQRMGEPPPPFLP